MGCPGVGPCTVYPLDLSCVLISGSVPEPCLADNTPVPQSVIDSSVLAASQFLWSVTGRQFSQCEVSIRPCRACLDDCCAIPELGFNSVGYPWSPVHLSNGDWINVSCECQNQCSCTNLCEVPLPYPACSINQVLIDGVVVDPATYRIDEFSKLVRIGSECWPSCNNLTLPPTEVGTWQITLQYGLPVPELVLKAAAEFAGELIKSCVGKSCGLPKNITAVSRQGVSEVFANPLDFIKSGYTGLPLTDLAIRAYNPHMLQRRSTVYSPDVKNWRVAGT